MGRAPCCEKVGLNRGKWTPEEDDILIKYIQAHGEGSWRSLPKNAGLLRCGKSCRLRWINYLRADLKRGSFSAEEEDLIIKLHASFGSRWSMIAGELPGRTDNEIKNYWDSHLRRRSQTFLIRRSSKPDALIIKLAKKGCGREPNTSGLTINKANNNTNMGGVSKSGPSQETLLSAMKNIKKVASISCEGMSSESPCIDEVPLQSLMSEDDETKESMVLDSNGTQERQEHVVKGPCQDREEGILGPREEIQSVIKTCGTSHWEKDMAPSHEKGGLEENGVVSPIEVEGSNEVWTFCDEKGGNGIMGIGGEGDKEVLEPNKRASEEGESGGLSSNGEGSSFSSMKSCVGVSSWFGDERFDLDYWENICWQDMSLEDGEMFTWM